MDPWLIVGFVGQTFFFGRFLVQWIAAEKQGESVVPSAFWYLSIGGSLLLLLYALHLKDPVFLAGQALGSLVYARNLVLIHRNRSTA